MLAMSFGYCRNYQSLQTFSTFLERFLVRTVIVEVSFLHAAACRRSTHRRPFTYSESGHTPGLYYLIVC